MGGIKCRNNILSFLVMTFCFISAFYAISSFHRFAYALDNRPVKKNALKLNIFSSNGWAVGSVDTSGKICNINGKVVGTVDTAGNVLNAKGKVVGKVGSDGKVFNHLGSVLGSVKTNGSVFNRSGKKTGTVHAFGNIFLIGGAAHLILLENN